MRWISAIGMAVLAVLFQGCGSRFPVDAGQVMRIVPANPPLPDTVPGDIVPDDDVPGDGVPGDGVPGDGETLQITWHGTASYELKLGDLSVLLDPFVSHQGLFHSVLGGTIRSDAERVRATFGALDKPQGIFVAHAHWDHLMDVHQILALRDWSDVPVFGSPTAKNILLGYPSITEESLDFRTAQTCGSWQKVTETPTSLVEYKAFKSGHAPHFLGIRLYDGVVDNPRDKAPRKAHHFKLGKIYAFALRLTQGETSYTVYFQSSASSWNADSIPDGLETLKDVDVAILCVSGWNKVKNYPEGLIQQLEPAHILLSHFDNFFQKRDLKNPARPEVVPSARLQGFLRKVQESITYSHWQQIIAPDVGTTLRFEK